jgi:hypothetical protein
MMQQPQMPGQAPTMSGLFSAMQAKQGVQQPTPGIVDALVKKSYNELLQMYHNPPPGIPTYAIIAARDQQIKEEQLRKAREIQEAQAKLAQQPRTVAEGVMGAPNPPQGVMGTVNAAQGGLMQVQGFQAGGSMPFPGREDPEVDENGYPRSPAGRAATIDRNARAQRAYEQQQAARRRIEAAGARPLTSLNTAAGYPIEAIRRIQELQPLGRGAGETPAERAQRESRATEPVTPRQSFVQQATGLPAALLRGKTGDPNQDIGVAELPRQAPPAPRQTPPLPAARPPAATQPPPLAQAPGIASALPPGTTPFSIEDYMRQVRGAGNVPEDEKALREALLKGREARLTRRAQQREEYGRSLDMTPEEQQQAAIAAMLGGARGAKSFGEFLSGAAQGVGDFETKQREQQRQLRKELMTLEDAEENLRDALREKELAYRSGDRERKVAAEIKASEALREYQFKLASEGREEEKVKAEKDLRAAQKLAAEAERTRAQQGGGRESRVDTGQVSAIRALLEEANTVAASLNATPAQRAAAEQRAVRLREQLARLGGMTVDTAPTGAAPALRYNPATSKIE